MDKAQFNVDVESLGENAQPVIITESEYMRRMKEMSHFQPGMSFYGQMPDTYTIVLNADHKLVKEVLDDTNKTTAEALKPMVSELKGLSARLAALHQSQNGKKGVEYALVAFFSCHLIMSTERFRNLSSASPFSMPFCSNAKSMSWCTMLLPLA